MTVTKSELHKMHFAELVSEIERNVSTMKLALENTDSMTPDSFWNLLSNYSDYVTRTGIKMQITAESGSNYYQLEKEI